MTRELYYTGDRKRWKKKSHSGEKTKYKQEMSFPPKGGPWKKAFGSAAFQRHGDPPPPAEEYSIRSYKAQTGGNCHNEGPCASCASDQTLVRTNIIHLFVVQLVTTYPGRCGPQPGPGVTGRQARRLQSGSSSCRPSTGSLLEVSAGDLRGQTGC
ncbi:hypothetical protein AGIG_G17454 [Arapaima gigas]